MKRIKHIICLLAVALAGSGSLNAQGLGFYLGGKRVELVEGDSINFVNNGYVIDRPEQIGGMLDELQAT